MPQYRCWRHELIFANKWQYRFHREVECKRFLSQQNTCVFQYPNGTCCGQDFKKVATLIAHSYAEHKVITCAQCYKSSPYDQQDHFENHQHDDNVNIRTSKWYKRILINIFNPTTTLTDPYRCKFCSRSFKTYQGMLTHRTVHHIEQESGHDKLSCFMCGKKCRSKTSLWRHRELQHVGIFHLPNHNFIFLKHIIWKGGKAEESTDEDDDIVQPTVCPYEGIIVNVIEGTVEENFGEESVPVDAEMQKALDDIAREILSNDENRVIEEK